MYKEKNRVYKMIKKMFHFLGSYYFALILIFFLAIIVALGTFLESIFDSHLYAADFTYGSPVFSFLLACVFINVLFSALRRWPFKLKHIPFLITHLGLLMIISGTIIKIFYGVQGTMALVEGMGSDQILIPQTFVVKIEKKDSYNEKLQFQDFELIGGRRLKPLQANSDLKVEIVDYAANSTEVISAWIKGEFCYISGLSSFPVYSFDQFDQKLTPLSSRVKLFEKSPEVWDIYALRTNDVLEAIQKIFSYGTEVFFHKLNDFSVFTSRPLLHNENLIIEMDDRATLTSANLSLNGIDMPLLAKDMLLREFTISNEQVVELKTIPKLIFIQNEDEETFFIAIDRYGNIHLEYFPSNGIGNMIVYDRGFGGYHAFAKIPFFSYDYSPIDIYESKLHHLSTILQRAIEEDKILAPPLQQLYEAAQHTSLEFPELVILFLRSMTSNQSDLIQTIGEQMKESGISLENLLPKFTQNSEAVDFLKNYYFSLKLRKKIIEKIPISEKLSRKELIALIENLPENNSLISTLLNMYSLNENSPRKDLIIKIKEDLPFLSFRNHLQNFSDDKNIVLETPLASKIKSLPPQQKLEQNIPKVTLKVSNNNHQHEIVTLSYDRFENGLAWPIFNGAYQIKFQSKQYKIPVHIRLQQARQINYPNSMQPFSYESDLFVKDQTLSPFKPVTVSMNRVFESIQGYRFYLSNISSIGQSAIQKIQLVVNYDPVKYTITYPGALLVALGIFSLFWWKMCLSRYFVK